MSYTRRRNSIHIHINGYRIRKDVFWRWAATATLILSLISFSAIWTLYRKDTGFRQRAISALHTLTANTD